MMPWVRSASVMSELNLGIRDSKICSLSCFQVHGYLPSSLLQQVGQALICLFTFIFCSFFSFDDRERTQDFPHVFAWKTQQEEGNASFCRRVQPGLGYFCTIPPLPPPQKKKDCELQLGICKFARERCVLMCVWTSESNR